MAWVLLIVFLCLAGVVALYLLLVHKEREAASRRPAVRSDDAEEAGSRLARVVDRATFTLGETSLPAADQRHVQPRPAASTPRVATPNRTTATASAPVPATARRGSTSPPTRRDTRPAASVGPLCWIGVQSRITIRDLTLSSPFAYFVDSRRQPRHGEPAAVDLALPVAARGGHSGQRELGYWPRP